MFRGKKRSLKTIPLLAALAALIIMTMGQSVTYAAGSLDGQGRYTVQSGDSLYKIAGAFGTTVNNLKTANSLQSDTIYPGQLLTVGKTGVAGLNVYTVKTGDTLGAIAYKYGITVDRLKGANNMASNAITAGQVLAMPGKTFKTVLAEKGINAATAKFEIHEDKTDHILIMYANGIALKAYHVEFGDSGLGDKNVSGDHKTPEGTFYISQKSVLSPADQYLGTRWMRLSYPNIEDAERGLSQGIISKSTYNAIVTAINNGTTPPQNTALGGGVGIHGGSTTLLGKDWTFGCTGLSNRDVEEIYGYVKVGTKVIIQR